MKRRDLETRRLLAAEYVLGTLRGPARRRFERMRAEDAVYCVEIDAWERRLSRLTEALPERTPPPHIWQALEREIAGEDVKAAQRSTGIWRNLGFWRASALAAAAAAILLTLAVVTGERSSVPHPGLPSGLAVVSDEAGRAVALLRTDEGGKTLSIEALGALEPPEERSLELWLVPADGGAPRSLGLVALAPGEAKAVAVPADLPPAAAFAISLEPSGGSAGDAPSGPILYQGAHSPTANR